MHMYILSIHAIYTRQKSHSCVSKAFSTNCAAVQRIMGAGVCLVVIHVAQSPIMQSTGSSSQGP